MGGFLAGLYAAKYSSLLSSLVLMCPAGINAPQLSEFISEVATGGKNYLLPENPEDFRLMLQKVSHRNIFIPFFIIKIMCAARQQGHEFYEKGNCLLFKFLSYNNSNKLSLWGYSHFYNKCQIGRHISTAFSITFTSCFFCNKVLVSCKGHIQLLSMTICCQFQFFLILWCLWDLSTSDRNVVGFI